MIKLSQNTFAVPEKLTWWHPSHRGSWTLNPNFQLYQKYLKPLRMNWFIQVPIENMPCQLSCCCVCKIVTSLDHWNPKWKKTVFSQGFIYELKYLSREVSWWNIISWYHEFLFYMSHTNKISHTILSRYCYTLFRCGYIILLGICLWIIHPYCSIYRDRGNRMVLWASMKWFWQI